MKNYLIARSQGQMQLAVVWDMEAGTVTVNIPGAIPSLEKKFEDVSLDQGVEGWGAIHWRGQKFAITKFHHDELEAKFPTLDVEEQYRLADAWCVNKGKEIKNSYQFMSNWLKKARGGNVAAGNVVY